jgi:hypothetical protein
MEKNRNNHYSKKGNNKNSSRIEGRRISRDLNLVQL